MYITLSHIHLVISLQYLRLATDKDKDEREKLITAKKMKRKEKTSTTFRTKIKNIKKTAISSRKRKRAEIFDQKKEKNDVVSKNDSENSEKSVISVTM